MKRIEKMAAALAVLLLLVLAAGCGDAGELEHRGGTA